MFIFHQLTFEIETMKSLILLPFLICMGFGLQAKGSKEDDQKLTKVKLQLKWKHQFQFAGYYAAVEKGFYEDAGLDVQLIEASEGEDASQVVFSGKADFGVCTSDIVMHRANGHDAVLLASIFQHSPQVLITNQNSGIKYAQDLVGKKIALEPNSADIISYMNDERVSLDQCILFPHLFSVDALINGEIDALSAYLSDEPFIMQERKMDYAIISPAMGGIDFYGDVLFTTERLLVKSPELVDAFRKASLKGWQYAMNHDDEMIDLIWSKYSQRHSKEHLKFEAVEMQRLIMSNVVEIGYSNPGRWGQILNIYKELRMLDSKSTTEGLFYEEYVVEKKEVPWKLLGTLSLVILIFGSATYFYYNSTRKLSIEVRRRTEIEKDLLQSEQELKLANQTKDKFYSIIAHDLRDPFTAIIGYVDIVIEDFNNHRTKDISEHLEIVKLTADRMLNLLNNLLNWSRSQLGHMEYKPELFDLGEKIEENLNFVHIQAKRKNIKLTSSIQSGGTAFADRNMINTVLHNLLTNAIKFTKIGGEVTLGLEEKGNEFYVSVRDTGVGIKQEDISLMFEKEKLHSTIGTEREKGSGLGLMICQEFIERHGGRIWVESEEGKGSNFGFILFKNNI